MIRRVQKNNCQLREQLYEAFLYKIDIYKNLLQKRILSLQHSHFRIIITMNTKISEKTVSNASNNNQKSEGMSMSFYEKKRQQLQKQHEERKRAQQLRQEALKKSKKISNQKNQIQYSTNKKQKNTPNTQSKVLQNLSQIHKIPSSIQIQNQEIEPQITKKRISVEEIIRDGRIVKVIERTLTFDEYKVQCLYDGEIMELIASKDEIVRNNIIPLLDFYQKILGLR